MSLKKYWDKFWFLLWKDNSLKGWLFSIIFLVLFVKLIFFPTLSLITGTALPLAIVESCSMHHKNNLFSNFDSWWERHEAKYNQFNIERDTFKEFSFKNGFTKGDIIFILGVKPEKIKVGDVIIFNQRYQNPIVHRVIEIKELNNELIFSTIGDNNSGQIKNQVTDETNIKSDEIVGKAVFRIAPYAGWMKLIFFELKRSPEDRGFCKEKLN